MDVFFVTNMVFLDPKVEDSPLYCLDISNRWLPKTYWFPCLHLICNGKTLYSKRDRHDIRITSSL